jgi:hypothetical protein
VRELLGRRLRETPCLKKLEIKLCIPHHHLAAGLVEGLGGNNSLEMLRFWTRREDVAEATHLLTILDSLSDNQTLQQLDAWTYYTNASPELCRALARLFRVNKSVHRVYLPGLYLTEHLMHVLLDGLSSNTTMKSLNMSSCRIDVPDLLSFGRPWLTRKLCLWQRWISLASQVNILCCLTLTPASTTLPVCSR